MPTETVTAVRPLDSDILLSKRRVTVLAEAGGTRYQGTKNRAGGEQDEFRPVVKTVGRTKEHDTAGLTRNIPSTILQGHRTYYNSWQIQHSAQPNKGFKRKMESKQYSHGLSAIVPEIRH